MHVFKLCMYDINYHINNYLFSIEKLLVNTLINIVNNLLFLKKGNTELNILNKIIQN